MNHLFTPDDMKNNQKVFDSIRIDKQIVELGNYHKLYYYISLGVLKCMGDTYTYASISKLDETDILFFPMWVANTSEQYLTPCEDIFFFMDKKDVELVKSLLYTDQDRTKIELGTTLLLQKAKEFNLI